MAELERSAPHDVPSGRTTTASANGFSAQEQAAINQQLALPVTTPNVQGTEPVAAAPSGTTIDQLLTPTQDTPGDAYVHFGNVQVERALVADWKAAQQYLAKDPEALNVLNALETGTSTITVHQISDGNDLFDPSTKTIDWDPHSALIDTDGSKQTPALALLHEQGHASEFERDPTRQQNNANTGNQRFDNAEEQRNIMGLETRAAGVLGEGTRGDHGGTPFVVKGPTSLEPTGQVMTDPSQLRQAIEGERFGLAIHGYTAPPPAGKAASSIEPWDKGAHTGSVVHIDGNTVAQYVGGGKYQVYDIVNDLHGVVPPENVPGVSIDAKGVVNVPSQAQTLAPGQQAPAAVGR